MIETTGEGKSAVATPDGEKPKEEEDGTVLIEHACSSFVSTLMCTALKLPKGNWPCELSAPSFAQRNLSITQNHMSRSVNIASVAKLLV